MPQYEDLKLDTLRAIYNDSFRPGSLSEFRVTDLEHVLPAAMIKGITKTILEHLTDEKYLNCDVEGCYSITNEGIRHVEFIFEDLEVANNKEGISAAQGLKIGLPASDRLVSLNHNGSPYVQAIKALDEAMVAFSQDHRLENEWGAEKGVLIRSIEGGQRLLQEARVRVRSIVATTVDPLRIVAGRYRDAIAAGLVTASVDRVLPSIEKAIILLLKLLGLA